MEDALPDDIEQLKRLLAEQEALNRALQAKLEERERDYAMWGEKCHSDGIRTPHHLTFHRVLPTVAVAEFPCS